MTNKIKTNFNRVVNTLEDNKETIAKFAIAYVVSVAFFSLIAVKALEEENHNLYAELAKREAYDYIKIRVFLNEKGEDIEIPMTPSAE